MSSTNASSSTKSKAKASKISRSERAGLEFPVARIDRYLKTGKYASSVSAAAPVYMTAVLEYMATEVLELAGNEATSEKKKRISPRHIQKAIRNDEEISTLLGDVTIRGSGM